MFAPPVPLGQRYTITCSNGDIVDGTLSYIDGRFIQLSEASLLTRAGASGWFDLMFVTVAHAVHISPYPMYAIPAE